jgi:ATP-binding cassette, subfamily B, bacterial
MSGRWQRFTKQVSAFASVARRLAPFVRGLKTQLALAFSAGVGYTLLRLAEPWPLKLIFDHVILGQPLSPNLLAIAPWAANPGTLLLVLVSCIILIALSAGAFYYWQNVLAAHSGQRVVARLRAALFAHLHHMDFAFHDRRKTGDLVVRLVADIRLLRDALVKLPIQISENFLLMIGMAIVMLIMDWRLTLIALATLPLLLVLVQRYRKPMRTAIRKQRRQEGGIANIITESLGAVRAIQSLGLEEHEKRRFGGSNDRSLKEGVKVARMEAKLRWASELSVGVITALVIGFAVQRIQAGALSPGDLIVFVTYLRTFSRPLRRVSRTTEQVTRTSTAGERVFEIFDLTPGIQNLADAQPAPALKGAISFEGAGFRYGRMPWALRKIDLDVRPGERLGIVGPTGSGKSSLVNLIPRFYDAVEGRVCVDGRDVRSLTLDSLRGQIGIVFQEPVLFAATVAENIALGRPGATRAGIEEAARSAGIHDIILGLGEGYETMLGERGSMLSGGQKQCIAIARTILRDAPIVILDEPTTGLDQRSASLVLGALQHLMTGRTVLIISHDLHRLRDTDRIVVLEHGRIQQEGRYEELAASQGLFRELIEHGRVR